MSFKERLADRNISDKEWRIFERHLTKWLSDNSRNLTHEEGKHFRTATAICLTTGFSTGILTNVLLNRFKLIPNRLTRGLFSVFGGLYTSAFTINSLRKNIYLKLLDSNGPAGFASRKILESTKELSIDKNYIDPIYLPSHKSDLYNSNITNSGFNSNVSNDKTSDFKPNVKISNNNVSGYFNSNMSNNEYSVNDNSLNDFSERYKTWDEIRKGN